MVNTTDRTFCTFVGDPARPQRCRSAPMRSKIPLFNHQTTLAPAGLDAALNASEPPLFVRGVRHGGSHFAFDLGRNGPGVSCSASRDARPADAECWPYRRP